jgi:hypothetical protein
MVKDMIAQDVIDEFSLNECPDQQLCKPCATEKNDRGPYTGSLVTKDTEVGDHTFSDVCGPLQMESIGGARYILTFIDGAPRFTSTHLIVKKSEVTAEWKK